MFKRIGNNIASRISPTRTHWSGLRAGLSDRLESFRKDRGCEDQKALERDFALLLASWGIEHEGTIPVILSDLRLRSLLLMIAAGFALVSALLMPGLYSLLTLILVAPPCLLGILTTCWRISILKSRAFTPLSSWLTTWIIPQKRRV